MAAKQVPGPSRTTEENATMHLWKKEALKSMREELGRVPMDVVMIKKLEKADIPSPDNKGFLSHEQLHVVESKTTRAEQMNMVIDYLLEMEDKYFEDFCTILKQCNFEGKAYMLRGKAEEFKRYFDAQEAASIAAMPPPPPGGDSNADEAALKRLCWIPFGIKTVSIEAKGGILCLEPTSDDLQEMKEDTIFVEVPPDAVSTSADVKMHYAIIPSGSFTLPEGYRFGSPVVYIYYDSQRVTKPLTLHLPHCYGGEDHARDGLSFAVAPHSLKGGMTAYQFQLIGGGTFYKYQQNGIFLIDGHSTLFADVFKEKATSVYLATQWEQRLANKTHTKIVITYFSKVWPKIVAKYWKGWKQNKHTSPTLFQFAGSWLSWLPGSTKSRVCGQLSCRHGQGWTATLVGANTVNQEDVAFRNKYNEQELEDLVAEGLYPPAIHCAVTYSRPPDFEHVSLETLEVGMTGTDKQQVTFPVEVYQAKDTEADADGAGTKDRPPAKRHKPDHSKKDIDEPGSSADRRQAKKTKRDHSKKDTEEADTEDRPPAKKRKPDHSEKGKTKAFAVITANETEQKVVRHFLKLFEDAGEVWTDAENCDYNNDVYLKQQRVEVKYMYTETVHGEYSYDFEVFTLSAVEKQIIGIHVKCLQQAAETKGGSRNTTRRLLKFADEQNWKLEVIFSVGCCMLSADKRSKNARKMMGHVLLSSEYEAFLERGKVEGRRGRRGRSRKGDKYEFMFHSQFYEGAREWVSRLQEHIITEPSKRGDLKTFRKIPVKEVPRFLCGPVVVKSADFGDDVRGNANIVGIEMEGSGIASALKDWKEDRETVPKFLLLKGVSDLGKGKGDDLEAMFFNEPTKEAVSDDVRQQIATFHCIALVVRGVAAHYLCTRRPSDGV